jgi:hypothetical protein
MHCSMPRRARAAPGEIIYHALDRANGRAPNWVNRAQTEAENRGGGIPRREGYGCDHKSQLS